MNGLERVLEVAAANADDVDRRARFPLETVGALGEEGFLGLTVPEALGGLGKGPAEFSHVTTELARRCASSAMVFTMHVAAMQVLSQAGDGAFDGVLRAAAAGEHLSTLALSERATRSNFWISMGHAERTDGKGWRLEVEKSFVTSAGPANSYVVSTATPGRSSFDESELFLVHADDAGVEVLDWWQGSGLRGNSSAPMRFCCELPDDAHIGKPGGGRQLMLEVILPWFQLGAASVSTGIALAAADAAREHVSTAVLEHLQLRLMDQPVVRHGLGRLISQVDALAAFVSGVAGAMARGEATLEQVLELKVVANEGAMEATDRAMRLLGGVGYSGRGPGDRLFRDGRAGAVMAPTADMLYDMIGRVATGLPPI